MAGAGADLPAVRIVNLRPGVARIAGRVVAGRDRLRAPLSGRDCVYYQIHGKNHRRPWHDRFNYPPQGARFEIEDDSGRIYLNLPPQPAEDPGRVGAGARPFCEISGDTFRRTIYDGESPELDRLLDPGRFASARDAYLDAEERIITEGDRVTAIGEVIEEIKPEGTSPNYRTPPMCLTFWVQKIRT